MNMAAQQGSTWLQEVVCRFFEAGFFHEHWGAEQVVTVAMWLLVELIHWDGLSGWTVTC